MRLTVKELKQAIEELEDSDTVMIEIGGDESSYGELHSVMCVDLNSDFKLLLSCEKEKIGYSEVTNEEKKRNELIELIREEAKCEQAEVRYFFENYSASDNVILITDLEDILNKLKEDQE